jgi:hypothetical protein
VRLDLDGEIVRIVPVNDNQSKDEEEDPFPDITGCQVCIYIGLCIFCKVKIMCNML